MSKIEEIWKPIPDYEDAYEISSLGRVRSLHRVVPMKNGGTKTIKERILSLNYDKNLYPSVMLCQDCITNRIKIHKMVCLVFNGIPDIEEPTVNHKDGNKSNNRFDNLEWMTLQDNIKHGFDTGLIKKKKSELTEKQVKDILLDNRSQHVIAKDYGVSQGTISHCKTGKTKNYS